MEIQTRIAFDQINLVSHSKSFSFRSSEQEDPGPESDPTRRSIYIIKTEVHFSNVWKHE